MTRIALCAPDKLRGALDATAAAAALAAGAADAGWTAIEHPLADGGEGTAAAIVRARAGSLVDVPVVDALGRARTAQLGVLPDGTCIVEAAEAIGLGRLRPRERDVMASSSRGLGLLLLAALERDAPRIVIALGGSATVDGGLGFLRALGADIRDASGVELGGQGRDVLRVARLDRTGLDARLARTPLLVALDVQNPLAGPDGAAVVYGPQKGASAQQVEELDGGLRRLGGLMGATAERPGAGAAGGLGAALLWLGAEPASGADLVMSETRFAERLAQAELVLTAEGSVDRQSAAGKTVARVAAAARAADRPCVVLGGRVTGDAEALYDVGASAVLGIGREARGLRAALRATPDDLRAAARAICGLYDAVA
jgi:glycerate kinase